jgi:hypothetical protein
MNPDRITIESKGGGKPGVRLDRRTGQYIPTINDMDVSPTSFDKARAMELSTKISKMPAFFVVVLDGGSEYLKEFSIASNGEEKARQLAASYREGYIDAMKAAEGRIKCVSCMERFQDPESNLNQCRECDAAMGVSKA